MWMLRWLLSHQRGHCLENVASVLKDLQSTIAWPHWPETPARFEPSLHADTLSDIVETTYTGLVQHADRLFDIVETNYTGLVQHADRLRYCTNKLSIPIN